MEMPKQKKIRSGTGKLLHMMRWSRPDVLNAVRELSEHMKEANLVHCKAMHRVMEYVMRTPKRGLTLAPNGAWDGSKDFEFAVKVMQMQLMRVIQMLDLALEDGQCF